MPFDVQPNQDFLKFISKEDIKKEKVGNGEHGRVKNSFTNLELILNLESNYPGMFVKVMSNFEAVKQYRESLDENGRIITVSWEDALKKFYLNTKYVGVTKENEDISVLFSGKGLSQEIFDKANELRKKAQSNGTPEHLLDKSLQEETILESIERIKKQTEIELQTGKEIIEELYDKQFTYEWLSKNDPHNAIMGLFCSCCGTITSYTYGKDIAMASIISQNVQNIVIRNTRGEIIAKGTMYLNKEKGYGVINDFEINDKYRNHEKGESGRYNVEKTNKQEQEREMIFKAFQRGIKEFVIEYNKQNPNKPIEQINVGMGYNRLKAQVERFKKATTNLTVPDEYGFQDAANEQYILYERKEKMKSGQDR